MKPSPSHLKRYWQIASLLWKYGRSDLAQEMTAEDGFGVEKIPPADAQSQADGAAHAGQALPEQLADDLEAMGPTYVKLGQVLAGRADLLPDAYLKGLARLQDDVKPFPYAEVEEVVMAELGVRISKAFSRFDTEPMAAASLGQVHRAALRDGRPVVVKVQRPNIRQQIADDFEVLEQIAGFLDRHTAFGRRHRFLAILQEFRLTVQQELNYEREAHNLIALGKNLKDFKLIQVPQPVPDYCTRSVLTMEEVQGKKITALGPLALLELKGAPLAEELFKAYYGNLYLSLPDTQVPVYGQVPDARRSTMASIAARVTLVTALPSFQRACDSSNRASATSVPLPLLRMRTRGLSAALSATVAIACQASPPVLSSRV
jgi:predicted unusual protein kinase regulating ubiquinone biosynthesis (AarF/ABC1/UbiB family)